MEEIYQSMEWFKARGFETYNDDHAVFLVVDDIHILISASEVSYRAELYKEEQDNDTN